MNNYYYGPYGQYTPAYGQQYQQQYGQQIPQVQPVQQVNNLSGRMVDDISTVGANEVNLDGSPSIFVKRDLSEIYVKRWNQNGMIDTVQYKVTVPVAPKPDTGGFVIEDSIKSLQDTLASVNEKLDKALVSQRTRATSPKKEVEA